MLGLQGGGLAEEAELVDAEQDHNDAADAGKPGLMAAEEAAGGGKAQPQQEEGEADADNKEQSVDQYLPPGIADVALLVHRPGAPGQIAYVQGHQREHTGGKEAEQALDKDGEDRHTGFQL